MVAQVPRSEKLIYAVDWIITLLLSLVVITSITLVLEMFLSLAFVRNDVTSLNRNFGWIKLFVALLSFLVIYSAIGRGKFFTKLYVGYSLLLCVLLALKCLIEGNIDLLRIWGWYEIFSFTSVLGVPYILRNNTLFKQTATSSGERQVVPLDIKYKYKENSAEPEVDLNGLQQSDDSSAEYTQTESNIKHTNNSSSTKTQTTVRRLKEPKRATGVSEDSKAQQFMAVADPPNTEIAERITSLRRMAGISPVIKLDDNAGINSYNFNPKTNMVGDGSERKITLPNQEAKFEVEVEVEGVSFTDSNTTPNETEPGQDRNSLVKVSSKEGDEQSVTISKKESLELLQRLGLIRSKHVNS